MWHTPNSLRLDVYCQLKMLMLFAYDIHGILTRHKVPSGRTITGKYFEEYLKNTYDQRSERSALRLWQYPTILHDNATVHKVTRVASLFTSYGWEVLDHAPHSPDIRPCDYDLYPRMKEICEVYAMMTKMNLKLPWPSN